LIKIYKKTFCKL